LGGKADLKALSLRLILPLRVIPEDYPFYSLDGESSSGINTGLQKIDKGKKIVLKKGRLPAIAPAPAPAPAAIAPSGSTAAAPGTLFLSLVHFYRLAVKACPIHLGYRLFGVFILSEGHKSKSPRAPRITVGDDFRFGNFSVGCERLSQAVVRRIPA